VQALQKLCAGVSLVHTLFLLNSVKLLNRVEDKLFSPQQHNNKENLATGGFEWLNFEQLLSKSVF